ncbi:endonuclease/exonuclease/phosphatase family protein [Cohaesibacter celericrescens]|uniref:endonuclease/exonuclease/phosphatase family protein n=1 Tax=Cohaesibacter celericrescens TaxID=2067669 RepID=UPI00356358E4
MLIVVSYMPDFWFASFLAGMRFHLAVWMLLSALLGWAIQRDRFHSVFVVLGLMVLGQCIYVLQSNGFQPASQMTQGRPSIAVLSFNILENNKKSKDVVELIETSGADVAILLESKPLAKHLDRLSLTYGHRVGCGAKTPSCDLMILSKRPLNNIAVQTLSGFRPDRFIKAEIDLAGQSIQLAAVHIVKPYFGYTQAAELRKIYYSLNKVDKPLLLAGDFNSSVLATNIQSFMTALNLNTVPFEPNTWPVIGTVLGLPIDHVMTSKPLAIKGLERLPDNYGSNHFGLMAEIVLMDDSKRAQ